MFTSRIAATLVPILALLATILVPTVIDGSCTALECDEIPALSTQTDVAGGCQNRTEGGQVFAYGWDDLNATPAKMYSTKAILNVNPSLYNPPAQIQEFKKQSSTRCTAQCGRAFPVRGTSLFTQNNWPQNGKVDKYTCTMASP